MVWVGKEVDNTSYAIHNSPSSIAQCISFLLRSRLPWSAWSLMGRLPWVVPPLFSTAVHGRGLCGSRGTVPSCF